jgi:hypothetical protein
MKPLLLTILLLGALPVQAEGEFGVALGASKSGLALHLESAWNPQGFWAVAGRAALAADGQIQLAQAQFRLSLDVFRAVPRLGVFVGSNEGLSIGAEGAVDWFINRHFALRGAVSLDHRLNYDGRVGLVWLPWE